MLYLILVSTERRLLAEQLGWLFAEGVKIENKLVLNKVVGQTDNTYSFPTTRGTDTILSMSSTPGELE